MRVSERGGGALSNNKKPILIWGINKDNRYLMLASGAKDTGAYFFAKINETKNKSF